MKRITRKYVAFLGQPDVARLLAVALVTRMPLGMVGFAMLMFLREALGSFALAGAAAGVHFVAMAAAAPIQGRLVDRHGPRNLLFVTGIVQPLALLAVLAAARHGLAFAAIAVAAGVAGAFASPITTLTRTVWRHRFEHEDDRRTAFALDAVMIEINFVAGPAIIATLLAIAGTTVAFGFAIAAVVLAVSLFLASPALRYFHRGSGAPRALLGPLAEPRLVLLFFITSGLALSLGLLEVGYPAYGTALAAPALGGLLLSINSLGSAIGGAIFGGLHLRTSIERQYAGTLALMAVPLFLHAVVTPVALFAFVAFLAGAAIAPSIASQSVLVSRLAPPHHATEAFTWSSTFIVSGLGAGMALGGVLVETIGLRYVFAIGSAVVAAMALAALALPAGRPAERASAAD